MGAGTAKTRFPPWTAWLLVLFSLIALWLAAWPLVWRLAILPNLDPSRQGFRLEVFPQEEITGKAGSTRLGGPADLTLLQPYTALRARGVWVVPRQGVHRLRLTCDDHGGLALDRRQLILLHGSSGGQSGYYELALDPGPHFLELTLHNRQAQGWARLEVAAPGGDDYAPLPLDQLHPLDLGNLEAWLVAAQGLEQSALAALGGLLGACLCLGALGPAPVGASPWPRRLAALGAALAFAALWRQELVWAMDRALARDEHQFIASAVLLARDGLLPYVDYPYFHAPYLVGLLALAFSHLPSPLIAARAISACLALGCLGSVFWGALRALGVWPLAWRWATALALTALMSQEDLFRYTSGLAWNHDPSTLPALLALVWAWRGLNPVLRPGLVLASGFALAVAAGARLTYAPLSAAFLAAILFHHPSRWPALRYWSAGAVLGSLPFLTLLFWRPSPTLFGNLTYPHLNTIYKGGQGVMERLAQAWAEQVALDRLEIESLFNPARFDALLLVLLATALATWLASFLRRLPQANRPALAFACLPMLLLGALAPNPLQPQYLYPLVPFSLLAIVLAWGLTPLGRRARSALFSLLLYLAATLAWTAVAPPTTLASQCPWHSPAQVHRLGQQVAALAPPGPIITLTPILPLEGRRPIHPALAAAPFSWRVAPLVPPSQRSANGLLGRDELPALLTDTPPAAFLLGWEKDCYEAPLKQAAQAMGYHELPLAPGLFMWVR